MVERLLAQARAQGVASQPVPKAIIVPHAGYVYSGPVAAQVYARLEARRGVIKRVVLLGPSHRFAFQGIAMPSHDVYGCPLGGLRCDRHALAVIAGLPGVLTEDRAHAQEHSLEVQVPFLRAVLGEVDLVPLVVGSASVDAVVQVLMALWGGEETVIVISTDLSHFLDDDAARAFDAETIAGIETLSLLPLNRQNSACGRFPVAGLLVAAQRKGMGIETVATCTSADTAGTRERVVGYGAWALFEKDAATQEAEHQALLAAHGTALLQAARQAVESAAVGRDVASLITPLAAIPALALPAACFVTLTKAGALRGCIGSVMAWRSLAEDVVGNAVKAAVQDQRFAPVSQAEVAELRISLSVLTAPTPFPVRDRADLLQRLRPGIDGVILSDRGRRALFLPSVWEQIPNPEAFISHLWQKAGLPGSHWSETVEVQCFSSAYLSEPKD